jgi:hypothetical protein
MVAEGPRLAALRTTKSLDFYPPCAIVERSRITIDTPFGADRNVPTAKPATIFILQTQDRWLKTIFRSI